MTNERILFRLRVSAECCFFARPACDRGSSGDRVSRVLSSARAPQSSLLLPRRLARASSHECARMCAARGQRCGSTNLVVPWPARRANVVSRGRGRGRARVLLCSRWGVQLGCVLQRYLVLVASTYCYQGVFVQSRVRSHDPTWASPPFLPRDVSPAASRLAGSH